ncbi:MAG: ABC transporter ATP-binding protein [Crocinitomicaceae bacterium]
MGIVIKVENLSKQYRLGLVGASTFKEDAARWWSKMRGKDDPFLSLGVENDRTSVSDSKFVWSLRDVNFEVQQGEVLGIIGRNGAGKSTLLKILSKITSPTTGTVKAKGRIASLLEVGTGFHPELTGRENIFLNGAILGMRKHEIKSKLDEIIAFAGVERYIDTPVKRYSSGMYVRLAFAVAAHLENEILIIDEVLAVGDSEFQKKCLSKMGDISKGEGRTVLFVSHNLSSIQHLCSKSILLEKGLIKSIDYTDKILKLYSNLSSNKNDKLIDIELREGNGSLIFEDIIVTDNRGNNNGFVESFSEVTFSLFYRIDHSVKMNNVRIDLALDNNLGERVSWCSTDLLPFNFDFTKNKIDFKIMNFPLSPGEYSITLFSSVNNEISDWIQSCQVFQVLEKDYYQSGKIPPFKEVDVLLDFKII